MFIGLVTYPYGHIEFRGVVLLKGLLAAGARCCRVIAYGFMAFRFCVVLLAFLLSHFCLMHLVGAT